MLTLCEMTYGMLYEVLRGLMDFVLFPDPHYEGVVFLVEMRGKGAVGWGVVCLAPG